MPVFIKVDIWANIYSKNEGVQEMKKIIYAACLAAVLFGTVSCKMADEEKEIERPGVTAETNAIIISVPKIKNSKYVNIFRRTVTGSGSSAVYGTKYNIGQIMPDTDDNMISYTFKDSLVVNGTKYQYALRYKLNSSYTTTGWSSETEAVSAITAEPLPSIASGAKLLFDPELKQLKLSGGALAPSLSTVLDDYSLQIAMKNDKTTSLFQLQVAQGAGLADGDFIDLRSIMSADFFDKEILFIGFVYGITKKDTTNNYTENHWTLYSECPIFNKDGTKDLKGKLTVNFGGNGSGQQDYTPLAAYMQF